MISPQSKGSQNKPFSIFPDIKSLNNIENETTQKNQVISGWDSEISNKSEINKQNSKI